MTTLHGMDVNSLYAQGLNLLIDLGTQEDSRAGPVMVMASPVMSIYEKPTQRVLFDKRRDANPFFHLFESLWMLAGRDDSASLNHYVSDFGKRFAETGGHIHGAYGDRWRSALGFDQLDAIVKKLRSNPQDRQCVLQMWDAANGYEHYQDDLLGDWKDRPCNTHVYFRVRSHLRTEMRRLGALDMTVCCRSNDIIWGAYGANAVHFSMLQEYLAGRIGVNVGRMYQLSNNFHAYVDVLKKVRPAETDILYNRDIYPVPIGEDWSSWDDDLNIFMNWHDYLWSLDQESNDIDTPDGISNLWFHTVAGPMCQINWLWKNKRRTAARGHTIHVEAPDWRKAAEIWMDRRMHP